MLRKKDYLFVSTNVYVIRFIFSSSMKISSMKKFITAGFLSMMALTSFAQTALTNPFPKTIDVTGSAEMEIVPDEIYVEVELKEYDKKGSGKIDLEKIKADFLNKVRSIGIPDSLVTIASYDGYNNYYLLKKKQQKKNEMYASISYQIKFNSSRKMDELIDKLDDEATTNFQVIKTSHSKLQEYRKQLKIQAVRSAKEKAQYLAEAIGEQVGNAVTISEPQEIIFEPYYRNKMANAQYTLDAAAPEAANGPDFKKIKLKFEVKVVFALK